MISIAAQLLLFGPLKCSTFQEAREKALAMWLSQRPVHGVEGKTVFEDLIARLPGYQFHIIESPQVQDILVGVKKGLTGD
jgi:hypothetical protein